MINLKTADFLLLWEILVHARSITIIFVILIRFNPHNYQLISYSLAGAIGLEPWICFVTPAIPANQTSLGL